MQSLSCLLLLACVAGRLFISEMPFLSPVLSMGDMSEQIRPTLNLNEPLRVGLAFVLLAATAIWLIGGAVAGQILLRRRALAALIGAFVGLSLLSALHAADKRAATIVWIEQFSLMAACWLAAQIFADRRKLGLLLAVAAAVGATLCLKGFNQAFDEIPAMQAAQAQLLGEPENVFERLRAARINSAKPTGFFHLSNAFGSVLILLTACLAAVSLSRLRAGVRAMKGPEAPAGQIPLPLLQGICAALALLGCIVMLFMTGSAGAILAAAFAAICAGIVTLFHRRLRRHWRKAVIVAVVLAILGGGAVFAVGIANDRLPSKTMTVRWCYWTAAGKIVAERPLLGVGGGNFPDAYLRHRRAEAEEAVQDPHNTIAHALTQFGLPGGSVYLAVIAFGLIAVCRPRRGDSELPQGRPLPLIAALLVVGVGLLLLRAIDVGPWDEKAVILFEVVFPAAVFAALLLLFGRRPPEATDVRLVRIALGCGLAGFTLHNMVSIGAWMPGPATLFWVLLGAAMGLSDDAAPRQARRWRWPLAAGMLIIVVAVGWFVGRPTWVKTQALRQARDLFAAGSTELGDQLLLDAVKADRRDGSVSAERAKLYLYLAQRHPDQSDLYTLPALNAAEYAIWKCPARSSYHRLSANATALYAANRPGARGTVLVTKAWERSVDRDPMNVRLRIECAEAMLAAGMMAEAAEQLAAAQEIDEKLSADSLFRLTADERAKLDELRRRAAD
jgi:hypothetical protein